MAIALIGIGSNLGDRRTHLQFAREQLSQLPGTTLHAFSQIYETAPVGPVEQGMFLNAAAKVETSLSPRDLLTALQSIEQQAGRASRAERVHWGPRELDMDILFYDQQVLKEDDLTIPHPQLHKRWFVLKPLADIAPDFEHPVMHKTVDQLLYSVEHRCDLR
jgi:dihydroneopterin aldolase/2-amino-4-hydroxy-6-hydroxymethyldihydropteridine diphosphokinase